MLAMMMVAALCFTACGGGDDDNSSKSGGNGGGSQGVTSGIVGGWKVTDVSYNEGVQPMLEKGETLYMYQDGTFRSKSLSGTWVLNANNLVISAKGSVPVTYTVTTLTNTDLVLDYELDLGYHVFTAKYKFVRVQ